MTATMPWPEPPGAGPLGDGRFAIAVERPVDIDSLRSVVVERAAAGLALYPQGGSTALDHGGIPRVPGVAIDTRGLDRVVDYPAADMTITVEAGITLARLSAVLAKQNQRLLIDAPFPDRATLGGVYATNSCGPRRFGHGKPRDQILGVSFVTSNGELVKGGGRVVKNVAGYDLPRLLTGSMGTLGVICQMTLKVRPRPETSVIGWASFPNLETAGEALDALNLSATRPVAVELLNPLAAAEIARPLGLPGALWVVAVGFEDNATSVDWQVERLREELGGRSIIFRGDEDARPVWDALNAYQAAAAGPVTLQANLRPSTLAGFLSRIDSGRWAIRAHAGNGIVHAHAAPDLGFEEIAGDVQRLRALALGDGGNLTLPRCPTDWKAPLKVWGEPRADWTIAERVKQALDPAGLMNPGRFVGKI